MRRKAAEQSRLQPTSRAASVSVTVNANRREAESARTGGGGHGAGGKADKAERQLLEILLADAPLVTVAREKVRPESLTHTGLRRMLSELYAMQDAGTPADLDGLRVRLLDRPDLADAAGRLQDVGRGMSDRATWLGRVLNFFEEFRSETEKAAIQHELGGSVSDEQSVELLRRLVQKTSPPANSVGVNQAFN